MDKFYIVTNDGKDEELRITKRITEILDKHGKAYTLCEKDERKKIRLETVPEEIDCAIVIGGDGSFIDVARLFQYRDVPILGVNMGTLGYLTEVEPNEIEEALGKILKGDYRIEDHMMLESTYKGQSAIALNDVVIGRDSALKIIKFQLFVNGVLLNEYQADGIIISTPTGSTAYNLSAGGPVVEPTASMIVITPICSHALDNKSVVLSADDEIVIKLLQRRSHRIDVARITLDGVNMFNLNSNEIVTINKAKETTKFIKIEQRSFLDVLRKKMNGD
jgi:NAD+ kinase